MKKFSLALAFVVILFSSCMTLTHTVGSGGKAEKKSKKGHGTFFLVLFL
jgi:hypothetical protein